MLLPGMVHGVEMLKTGTTTINECWWHQPQSARIIKEVGLRGRGRCRDPRGRQLEDRLRPPRPRLGFAPRRGGAGGGRGAVRELARRRAAGASPAASRRTGPTACGRRRSGRLGDLARKHGVGLHTHLCAVPGENEFMLQAWGKKSVPLLRSSGCWAPISSAPIASTWTRTTSRSWWRPAACMSHTAFLVAKRGYYPPMKQIYAAGDAGFARQRLAVERHVQGDALGDHRAARALPGRRHAQCL